MGSFFEILVTAVGLGVAIWALKLQRDEIIKNSHINALIYTSQLLQEKLEYRSNIIGSKKDNINRLVAEKKALQADDGGKIQNAIDAERDWFNFHKELVNNELKPLKENIDIQIVQFASNYGGKHLFNADEINKALFTKETKLHHKEQENIRQKLLAEQQLSVKIKKLADKIKS